MWVLACERWETRLNSSNGLGVAFAVHSRPRIIYWRPTRTILYTQLQSSTTPPPPTPSSGVGKFHCEVGTDWEGGLVEEKGQHDDDDRAVRAFSGAKKGCGMKWYNA